MATTKKATLESLVSDFLNKGLEDRITERTIGKQRFRVLSIGKAVFSTGPVTSRRDGSVSGTSGPMNKPFWFYKNLS